MKHPSLQTSTEKRIKVKRNSQEEKSSRKNQAGVPERSKGPDSRSAAYSFVGSNPTTGTHSILFVFVDLFQLSNRIVLNFNSFQFTLRTLGNFE